MFRLWLVIGFLATVFYVYSIVNVSLSARIGVRGLPKSAWILVVVIFPIIGALLWYWVGRSGLRARVIAPDDDPEFLATLGNNSKRDDNGTDG